VRPWLTLCVQGEDRLDLDEGARKAVLLEHGLDLHPTQERTGQPPPSMGTQERTRGCGTLSNVMASKTGPVGESHTEGRHASQSPGY
jgi:hypothetical protein